MIAIGDMPSKVFGAVPAGAFRVGAAFPGRFGENALFLRIANPFDLLRRRQIGNEVAHLFRDVFLEPGHDFGESRLSRLLLLYDLIKPALGDPVSRIIRGFASGFLFGSVSTSKWNLPSF